MGTGLGLGHASTSERDAHANVLLFLLQHMQAAR